MLGTCEHANNMSVMIQIRNVPDEIHRKAKARAAMQGLTLSEFVLRELKISLARPSREDLLERLARYNEVELAPGAAEAVREERDRR